MHVRVGEEIRTGIDAFLALWQVVPGYRWLNAFISLPGIYWLSSVAYSCFARLRPLLPRRKRAGCESGVCEK